jgi:hypothetical protein
VGLSECLLPISPLVPDDIGVAPPPGDSFLRFHPSLLIDLPDVSEPLDISDVDGLPPADRFLAPTTQCR